MARFSLGAVFTLLVIVALLAATGCTGATNRSSSYEASDTLMANLVGTWTKQTFRPCSETYPDELELREGGIYMGRSDGFTLWDAGEYEVTGDGRVRISTANDAEITYRFSMENGTLTFEDNDGCTFRYIRRE